MPRRIVSIRRRAEKSGLRSEHVEYLFNGCNVSAMIGGFAEPTTDELRSLWKRHRARLLRWWFDGVPADAFQKVHISFQLLKPAPAGTRPWAWWKFEAPADPRRLRFVFDPVRRAATAEDLKRAWRDGEGEFGLPAGAGDGLWPYQFELEAEYLARHGLLPKAERKAIIAAEELAEEDPDGNT
jgi:hypothetical protein